MKGLVENNFWHDEQLLARDVETLARELNGLPAQQNSNSTLIAGRLQSAKTLLERALAIKTGPPRVEQKTHTDPAPVESLPDKVYEKLMGIADYAYAAAKQAEGGEAKFAQVIFDRLSKALVEGGIEILNRSGKFELETQQVVESAPTNDPAEDRVIRSTVRVGYRRGNRLLRRQEVVVYSLG